MVRLLMRPAVLGLLLAFLALGLPHWSYAEGIPALKILESQGS